MKGGMWDYLQYYEEKYIKNRKKRHSWKHKGKDVLLEELKLIQFDENMEKFVYRFCLLSQEQQAQWNPEQQQSHK
jgi:hypothetical protein